MELEESLRPCIVRISCGGYQGSGVIWEITKEEITVVSAGHLLKNGESCEIESYAGIFYEAGVSALSEECDIGFAVISAKEVWEDHTALKAAGVSARGADEMVRGEELAVFGSREIAGGDFVKAYLAQAEMEAELPVYGTWRSFLVGKTVGAPAGEEAAEKAQGPIDSGMSGSGVFDRQGCLVGILAGGDGKETFLAAPVWKFKDFKNND